LAADSAAVSTTKFMIPAAAGMPTMPKSRTNGLAWMPSAPAASRQGTMASSSAVDSR
jgi:hypothetical protein